MLKTIKFIDLFAGIGGMRLGLEKACENLGIKTECVFTSEIKTSAIKVYQDKKILNNQHLIYMLVWLLNHSMLQNLPHQN